MDLVQISLYVPKELNDVRVALTALIEDVKAGKSVAELVGENFQNLIEAVSGAVKIPQEFKEELKESMGVAGLMGGELLGALLDKPKV